MEQQVLETPVEQAAEVQSEQQAPDPFAVDEASIASLAPEARIAFETAVKGWRSKAEEHVKTASQKAAEEASSRYKDYDEQKKYADALRQLTGDPRFVQWYQYISTQSPQQQQQQMVASPEEYAQAVQEAAQGSPQRFNAIIARTFQAMAAPTMKEFNEQKIQMQQDKELDRLFKSHPDAEELDALGRTDDDSPSLLEWAVYDIVDKKRGTYEQAYQHARRIADQLSQKSKDAALGLVNGKKQSVTEKAPVQSKETDNIIEVASGEEALRKNIEASMRGQKVTYVAKSRLARK